ncbi:MAG: hypothetical protein ABFD21_07995 [Anaerolineaceae bacterium]
MKAKHWLILAASLVLLAGGVFAFTRSQDVAAQSPTPESYPASVSVQNFTPAGEKIQLGIRSAQASQDALTLTLTMSGVDYEEKVSNFRATGFEKLVCNPYIVAKEPVSVMFQAYEVKAGNPTQVVYTYSLKGSTTSELTLTMDWTIGPCAPAYDESNVKAQRNPLQTTYHFEFKVPVK